jgi:hypothetical protein
MARQQRKAQTTPTPESAKALADSLDHAGQHNFILLCLQDPKSHIGGWIRGVMTCALQRAEHLEKLAGIAPGDIDPEELLSRKETLQQASKRLGKSKNAIKQARHRAKQRRKLSLLPSFSVPA